jgi:hypothetical protein
MKCLEIRLHPSEKESILNDGIRDYVQLGGNLDQKLFHDNVKDGSMTLVFEIAILLKDMVDCYALWQFLKNKFTKLRAPLGRRRRAHAPRQSCERSIQNR